MADIRASIGLDSREADKAIEDVARKIDALLSKIQQGVKINVDASTAKAEASVKGAKTKLESALGKGLDVKVDADTKPATDTIRNAKGQFEKAGKEAGGAFSGAFGGAFAGFTLAGAVSAGVSALTGAASKAFEEYKALNTNLRNIGTLGIAEDSLGRFEGLINDLSTKVPDQASNIANGVYNAISAGITGTEEEIVGFVETASKVAVAGLSDTNTAVNGLTSVVNAYGLGAEGAQKASNVFFAAIKAGKTSFTELNGALAQVLPTASGLDINFETLAGTIAKLTTVGIPTAQASTTLNAALTELQKPGKDLEKVLEAAGLDVSKMADYLKDVDKGGIGLVGVLEKVKEGADKTGKTIGQAFSSSEAAKAVGALTKDLEGTKALLAGVQADVADGVADKAFASAAQSIEVQFGIIRNKIQAVFNEVFQAISPVISEVLSKVVDDIIPRLFGAISNIGDALAPLLSTIGTIVGGAVFAAVEGFVTVLEGLGAVFNFLKPAIVPIVAAVGALAVAMNASTIATKANAIIQKAWAIGTKAVAAAQRIFNVVMAANPIGAVIVAVTALIAGLYALKEALTVTAAEQLEAAEATKENIKQQIDQNKEQQKSVKGTQALVDEYKNLAANQNRTQAETDRLREVQGKLDAQYPSLIDQTKSFSDNLKGVDEIGRLATAQLGKLSGEATKLEKTMRETTKQIAGLARNTALEELDDSFGRFNLLSFDTGQENRFRQSLQKQVDTFKSEIFKAANDDQVAAAQAKLLDFLNLRGSELNDDTQLQDIINKTINAANKARAALSTWRGEADGVADAQQDIINPPPPDQPPPPDPKTIKEGKTALEQALNAYKKIEASQKSQLAAKLKELELNSALTEEERERQSEIIKSDSARLLQNRAREIFQASTNEFGLFLSSTLKLAADESVDTIRDVFTGLAFAVQPDVLISRTDVVRRFTPLVPLIEREIKPIEIPVEVPSRVEGVLKTSLNSIAQAIGPAVAAAFNFTPKVDREALAGEVANLKAQLKEGEISYAEYANKVDGINSQMKNSPNRLDLIFQGINAGIVKAMASVVSEVQKSMDELSAKVADGTLTISDSFELLAVSAASSFISMVADGQNALKALVVGALDALQALVPVFVAQITGINLAAPDNIATFGAAGVARAALFTALLQSLVAAARAAVSGAFATGGLVTGGERIIRVNERGPEYVINAKATQRYLPLLEAINTGKPLRSDLRRGLNLDKLGITFHDQAAKGLAVAEVVGGERHGRAILSELKAMRKDNEALRSEIAALRNNQQTTHRTEITIPIDERAMERRHAKRQLEYATKW